MTKNADIDKYTYSDYGVGFDRKSVFSFPGSGIGQNVIIFGINMSSSAYIDNKKKEILILGKGPTGLSLYYNWANSYLFVNGREIYKLKAKDEIVAILLCLANISKDWSLDDMKKTGFTGYVYDFSVDYDATVLMTY